MKKKRRRRNKKRYVMSERRIKTERGRRLKRSTKHSQEMDGY